MFPFIYIQCEEQREGAWQQKGDRRDEPSQSAQYKLAKSTQILTPHPLLSSLETHGKLPYYRGEKVIEPLTSSCADADVKVKHCCGSAKFVSTFHTLFSIKISSCLLLLGPLAAAYIIIPLCSEHHQPGRGGWGKMSRGHIFSPRFFQQL